MAKRIFILLSKLFLLLTLLQQCLLVLYSYTVFNVSKSQNPKTEFIIFSVCYVLPLLMLFSRYIKTFGLRIVIITNEILNIRKVKTASLFDISCNVIG